ncbi:MAG: 5-(carboxyamino)imidazole ribonucleotide mutase [Bacteroidetes bacterium]|nr:5-(carboxyamino)imidazole ribonucleotide mutase [Bacteroidota bacterium]MCL6098629.1 5-(carboxyamino)imidazole ribonucleotide mutase [Bacteroidota bacterium]
MKRTQVAILMGSDSDYPVMQKAENVFEEFNIDFETRVLSAHRTPRQTIQFISDSVKLGTKVFIAGAGGAAHLPGIIAAHTELPVIGVPILGKSTNGLDSLLSIVQMPPGVPVATVSIDGAKNAALLAVQILAVSDSGLKKKLIAYRKNMEKEVLKKDKNLPRSKK